MRNFRHQHDAVHALHGSRTWLMSAPMSAAVVAFVEMKLRVSPRPPPADARS